MQYIQTVTNSWVVSCIKLTEYSLVDCILYGGATITSKTRKNGLWCFGNLPHWRKTNIQHWTGRKKCDLMLSENEIKQRQKQLNLNNWKTLLCITIISTSVCRIKKLNGPRKGPGTRLLMPSQHK